MCELDTCGTHRYLTLVDRANREQYLVASLAPITPTSSNSVGFLALWRVSRPAVRTDAPRSVRRSGASAAAAWQPYRGARVERLPRHEMPAALAVSDNGHFLGVGCIEGSVLIYITFSLQVPLHHHYHHLF